jgi:small conductance mechanosensitive channel
MEAKTYFDKFLDFAWNYGPKALTAIIILFVGLWLIRRLSAGFQNFLKARKVDESLRPFFTSLIDVAMKVALLLVVAGQIGIETTSFIAVFSAMAFAVGLALQGSLGNFASGVLILLFRPYKVGDLITANNLTGRVTEIQIFNTILLTPQGKRIIIPNGKMTEGAIESIGEHAEVQAEISLLLASNTDLEKLRGIIQEISVKCPGALPDYAPQVHISGITNKDMKVQIGCWTTGLHYEDALNYMYEAIKSAFDANGIELAKIDRKSTV